MHNFELYGYGESVASNMARVALAEKKVTYKYNVVYLESKGEHLTTVSYTHLTLPTKRIV